MPNPPFSHADTHTVAMWNQVLYDNPCAAWADFEQAAYRAFIQETASRDVRPKRRRPWLG